MTNKKEQFKKVFSQILEPFALGLLALLFIIPSITVMNLTPLTKQLEKLNVLGVSSQDSLRITLVEGKHDIFSSEILNKIDDKNYTYSTTLNRRSSGTYSKPIIEVENKSEKEREVNIQGETLNNTYSNIYLIVEDKTLKIQDPQGRTYQQTIKIQQGEKIIIFLGIENLSNIQYSETFDLQVSYL